MVHQLRKSREKDSIDFLIRFGELIHTLIYLHPGFPELYDPVLVALEVSTLAQVEPTFGLEKCHLDKLPRSALVNNTVVFFFSCVLTF